MISSVKL